MPDRAGTQYALDFTPGLTAQFPELMDCVAATVYGSRGGLNAVAAACDVAPSTVSRWLNSWRTDEKKNPPMQYLPTILSVTGDYRPIYWLIEKFLEDETDANKRAMSELRSMLPRLIEIVGKAQ